DYFGYFMRHPYAIGWLPALWDPQAYDQPEHPLQVGAIAPRYFTDGSDFAGIERAYAARIHEMLSNARAVSRTVIAYPSPVLLRVASETGQDVAALRRQLQVALEVCRTVPDVVCIEPSFLYDKRADFYNLTHLNQHGHQEMATWLAQIVQPQ